MRYPTLLVLLLVACGGDKPPDDTDTDPTGGEGSGEGGGEGGGDFECEDDDGCGEGEICEDNVCEDGDRDNSVEDATSLLWDAEATGELNPAGDVDYYALLAEGGEYVRIRTLVESETGDTVLILRNPAGKVHATVDNYPTGGSTSTYDSTIYAYLPEAGTWTIQVEDQNTYYGGDTDPGPYSYTVSLAEWGAHTDETDAADDPSFDSEPDAASTLYPIGVVLEEEGDSDFIEVDFPWDDAALLVGGIRDLGGSELEPVVRLWTRDGVLLTQKTDIGVDGWALYPAMKEDRYVLEVADADGEGSPDHWTFLFLLIEDEGDAYPEETEPNDEAGLPDALDQDERTNSDGQDYTVAYFQGFGDAPGDEDWYRFEGMEDGYLVVCLQSSIYGSLSTPDLLLYDSAGELLETAEGDAGDDQNAVIVNYGLDDEVYYLVVRSPDDITGGPGDWYRSILYTASFEVGSYSCP